MILGVMRGQKSPYRGLQSIGDAPKSHISFDYVHLFECFSSAYSVWQVHTVVLHHPLRFLLNFCVFSRPVFLSGAAFPLHAAEELGLCGQGSGGGRVGGEGGGVGDVGVGGGGGGGGGGEERGVRAHLLDVDVGGVEQDVVLAAEAGEDGGDPGHEVGEGGAALRLRVPALHHQRV